MMNQLDTKKIVKELNLHIDHLKSNGQLDTASELNNLVKVIAAGAFNIQIWRD